MESTGPPALPKLRRPDVVTHCPLTPLTPTSFKPDDAFDQVVFMAASAARITHWLFQLKQHTKRENPPAILVLVNNITQTRHHIQAAEAAISSTPNLNYFIPPSYLESVRELIKTNNRSFAQHRSQLARNTHVHQPAPHWAAHQQAYQFLFRTTGDHAAIMALTRDQQDSMDSWEFQHAIVVHNNHAVASARHNLNQFALLAEPLQPFPPQDPIRLVITDATQRLPQAITTEEEYAHRHDRITPFHAANTVVDKVNISLARQRVCHGNQPQFWIIQNDTESHKKTTTPTAAITFLHAGTKVIKKFSQPYPIGYPAKAAIAHNQAILHELQELPVPEPMLETEVENSIAAARLNLHSTTHKALRRILETMENHGANPPQIRRYLLAITAGNQQLAQHFATMARAKLNIANIQDTLDILEQARRAGMDQHGLKTLTQRLGYDPQDLGLAPEPLSPTTADAIANVAQIHGLNQGAIRRLTDAMLSKPPQPN